MSRTLWTPERRAEVMRLREAGLKRWQIADAMGISFNSVRGAFNRPRPTFYEKAPSQRGPGDYVVPARIPPAVLAERDQRISAPHRDQTAAFCGDPPAGYSALDRR